jgi:hypothetical protein
MRGEDYYGGTKPASLPRPEPGVYWVQTAHLRYIDPNREVKNTDTTIDYWKNLTWENPNLEWDLVEIGSSPWHDQAMGSDCGFDWDEMPIVAIKRVPRPEELP